MAGNVSADTEKYGGRSRVRRVRGTGRSPVASENSISLTREMFGQASLVRVSTGQAMFSSGLSSPVVLLYGTVPDWRTLDEGVTGADVTQLNRDLVRLGDARAADIAALGWDYYSWETKVGVQKLQSKLGIAN